MNKTAKYHHEQGYELMCELLEDMEKSAVDIHGLRKMWSSIVKPRYARQAKAEAQGHARQIFGS